MVGITEPSGKEQFRPKARQTERGELGRLRMNRSRGFTLIELLVVIAIIGILAAIIFPVFARAKDGAYRSSDMSNMNSIRSALSLYRADNGAYPPAILGYATGYMNTIPSSGDIIPANQVVGALYPKRIDSLETLRPAYDRAINGQINTDFSRAVWPNQAVPFNASDRKTQRFGPSDGWVNRCANPGDTVPTDNYYYRISGYDAAGVKTPSGDQFELRYTLFWTGWTVPANPCQPIAATETGDASDDPRQLGYTDPPETTVVTWDSYFRDYTNGVPDRTKRDIVLFLGGAARPFDSAEVASKSWAVTP